MFSHMCQSKGAKGITIGSQKQIRLRINSHYICFKKKQTEAYKDNKRPVWLGTELGRQSFSSTVLYESFQIIKVQKRDRSIITVNDSVSFVQILWVGCWFYVQFCLKLQICKCNNNIDLDSPLGWFAWGHSLKIIFSASTSCGDQ